MADYIPSSDAEFNGWLGNFVTYASANLAELGLVAGDLDVITTAQTAWAGALASHVTAQQAAKSATQQKNADRAATVSLVRALAGQLQASADVDDTERAGLGITVPDAEPTPVGPPTTRPFLLTGCLQRLQHTIAFMDEATPTSKAKPAGVMGVEIWVKVGDPAPVDPIADLRFLGVDTRTPYLAEYSGADGGQPAHYMARWVNAKGEKGPWSETLTVTISA